MMLLTVIVVAGHARIRTDKREQALVAAVRMLEATAPSLDAASTATASRSTIRMC